MALIVWIRRRCVSCVVRVFVVFFHFFKLFCILGFYAFLSAVLLFMIASSMGLYLSGNGEINIRYNDDVKNNLRKFRGRPAPTTRAPLRRLAPTARRHGSDGLAAYIRLGVGPDRTGPDLTGRMSSHIRAIEYTRLLC